MRFVVRWPLRYHIRDEHGVARPLWQVTRGKRSWEQRPIWDVRRRGWRKVGVIAAPVYDVNLRRELTLVVSRPGPGRKPWYLLTNESVQSAEDAWRIVFAYARRWQVEMAIRFQKCELGAESPRLWKWEVRCKLLGLVALTYAFLLRLVTDPSLPTLVPDLLRHWCHRTGKRSRDISAPLYRLRMALTRLWLAYPPPVLARLNSG